MLFIYFPSNQTPSLYIIEKNKLHLEFKLKLMWKRIVQSDESIFKHLRPINKINNNINPLIKICRNIGADNKHEKHHR